MRERNKRAKKLLVLLLTVAVLISCVPFSYADDVTTVFIAGASIAETYPDTQAPRTGWGQKLGDYLPEGYQLENHAKSGTSSKSFIDEGRLDEIIAKIQEGDYLLIQFAHNDQNTAEAKYTEPFTTYKEYLKQYIDAARSKNATPILISPMERRSFDRQGNAAATLKDRALAIKQLAEAENVPFIDLQAKTLAWWDYLGPEETKNVFLHVAADVYPAFPTGSSDNTHLQESGADLVAQLIVSELALLDLPISEAIGEFASPLPAEVVAKLNEVVEKVVDPTAVYTEAAVEARALGLMQGYEDGTLGETNSTSRAELAELIYRVFQPAGQTSVAFADVSAEHWAYNSISALAGAGIIEGYDGNFFPSDTVTFAETVKILVEALGYGESAAQLGAYPDGYLALAKEKGITAGLTCAAEDAILRGDTARMLLNSLYVELPQGGKFADKLFGGKLMHFENFAELPEGWSNWGGLWSAEDGNLIESNGYARALRIYDAGLEWSDYEASLDVRSPRNMSGATSGIAFRADKEMKNYYAFRIVENTHLELASWTDGKFKSLDKWEFATEFETVYNLKVRAEGSTFTLYVNGEEVRTFTDEEGHKTGTVGCYTFTEPTDFDNVLVTALQ